MTTTIAPSPQNNNGSSHGMQNSNEGLLTLQEISDRLSVGYGRLRGFASIDGIGELLGAVTVANAKGVRYEPRSLEIFRRLIAAQDARQVIPATAKAWLETQEGRALEATSAGDVTLANPIAPSPQYNNSLEYNNSVAAAGEDAASLGFATRLLSGILAPVTAALERLAPLADLPAALREFAAAAHRPQDAAPTSAAALPAIEDTLLTAEEAALMLRCSPRSVSRHVAPVLPRRWRKSDVALYIRDLAPMTKTEPIQK